MSRVCEFTGKGPFAGNNVSHSNRKTRTRWLPNLQNKKYLINNLGLTISLKLSSRAIRTIDKQGGIETAIRNARLENLSPRLQKLKRQLVAKGKKTASQPATKSA